MSTPPRGERASEAWVFVGIAALATTLVPAVALDVLSWWGRLAWLGALLLGVGLVSARWRERRAWGPSRTGLLLLVVLLVFRCIAGGVSPVARARVLPSGEDARWMDRLVEERDFVVLAARLPSGWAPALPVRTLRVAEAYDAMENELGHRMGSHVLATWLGRDTGDASLSYVVEPTGEPRGSVVVLHGAGGNLLIGCWQVAVAARAAGLTTVCPSTDASGHWSNGHGERIARVALGWARRGDVTVLVGLDEGAVGASRLAPDLGGELDAMVLVSGVDAEAGDPGVPTLLVHADGDPASEAAHAYATAHADVRDTTVAAGQAPLYDAASVVRAELTRFFMARRDEAERTPGRASR